MTTLIIYHKDLDGVTAAAVILDMLESRNDGEEVHVLGFESGEITHDKVVQALFGWGAETLYLVDLSLPAEDLRDLSRYFGDAFVWIDHHKTALDAVKKLKFEYPTDTWIINGIRSANRAACELAWEWCRPDDHLISDIVKLAGDWDTWRWRKTGDERPYQLNTLMDELYPMSNYEIESINWIKNRLYLSASDSAITGPLEIGAKTIAEMRSQNQKIVNAEGIPVRIGEHHGMAINRSVRSTFFDGCDDYDELTFFMTFVYTQKGKVQCSLFSESGTLDCSAIAQRMGGGGHFGAAGFTTDPETFGRWLNTLTHKTTSE